MINAAKQNPTDLLTERKETMHRVECHAYDQDEHLLVYSLLPHIGDWREEVITAAYDLNDPLIARCIKGTSSSESVLISLVSASAPCVVKKAEMVTALLSVCTKINAGASGQ